VRLCFHRVSLRVFDVITEHWGREMRVDLVCVGGGSGGTGRKKRKGRKGRKARKARKEVGSLWMFGNGSQVCRRGIRFVLPFLNALQ
jgi:hypothetical protein